MYEYRGERPAPKRGPVAQLLWDLLYGLAVMAGLVTGVVLAALLIAL